MKKNALTTACQKIIAVILIVASFSIIVAFTINHNKKEFSAEVNNKEGVDDDEPLSGSCGGVERWDVKVMTDTAAYRLVLTPKETSIIHLITLPTPTPSSSMPRYNPVEDSVYTVVCTITIKITESDSDYHLVLSDGSNTMIGEVPDPNCSSVAASPYINNFIVARKWVDSVIGKGTYYSLDFRNVQVTGQAFIDPPHGQDGAAPNNLELHSIIKINFYNPAAINTIALSEGIRVYPNPSNGIYYLSMPASDGDEKVEVFNITGEKIFQTLIQSTKTQINISGNPSGIYLYRITKKDGEFISNGKLLIIN